jgi:hypothetical protein
MNAVASLPISIVPVHGTDSCPSLGLPARHPMDQD